MSIYRCPSYTQETCLLTYLSKIYEAQLLVIKAIPSISKIDKCTWKTEDDLNLDMIEFSL